MGYMGMVNRDWKMMRLHKPSKQLGARILILHKKFLGPCGLKNVSKLLVLCISLASDPTTFQQLEQVLQQTSNLNLPQRPDHGSLRRLWEVLRLFAIGAARETVKRLLF
jgi:hypothetical protein